MRSGTNKQSNLASLAYETIHKRIFSNVIQQGEIISENQIAQELGMSRTPVREALRMLASENLVEVRNGVGTIVKPITLQNIRDLFEIRSALEILAARTAMYRITDEEVKRFELLFDQFIKQKEQGVAVDPAMFAAMDWEFHTFLVGKSRNEYVKSVIQGIHANIRRCQELSFVALNDVETSASEHLQILDYIHKLDEEGLIQALSAHLKWSASILLEP